MTTFLKDLKFDEQGSTGIPLPNGNWLDIEVRFDPENPIENKFTLRELSPATAYEPKEEENFWPDCHPMQAQAIIVMLTSPERP